jgi:molybdate transport system ATP-binding protein
MIDHSPNPHPLKLAAIIYRPADDVDSLLAGFASDLICEGNRIGGIVQRNIKDEHGGRERMEVIDLMTGTSIRICQSLGSGAAACKLEAAGNGLRAEIADAVVAGRPLLTAVPDKCYDAWSRFTGNFGTTLVCERRIVEDWWREMSLREKRARIFAHFDKTSASAPRAKLAFRGSSLRDHDVRGLDHR